MKKSFLILSFIITLVSCNKKKTTDPVAPPPNNVTSTYETGLIDLFRAQYFDGTNTVTTGDNVTVTFINYDNTPNSSLEVSAGNVNVNGTGLYFNGVNYEDTTYAINLSPATFSLHVSGSSQINAFTTTFNPVYPSFTGDALLPTTVSKSTGFTINLGSSISNMTDTATIHLLGSVVKKIAPGQASVTFTPADISGIMVANGYYFELYVYNTQPLNINSNAYYLRTELQYTKYNINVVP
jgi:hypothetical protein